MTFPEHIVEQVYRHANEVVPLECCGLILHCGGYVRCENVSPTPRDDFVIADETYLRYESDVVGIAHSHVGYPPVASGRDKASCRATGVPWLIVSVPQGGHTILRPESIAKPSLMGREYVSVAQDCLVFVLDALEEFHGLTFSDGAFPRAAHQDWRAMIRYAQAQGFAVNEPDRVTPLAGDVVLMFVRGRGHLGLMVGGGNFVHHDLGRLSEESVYDGFWRKHTVALLRHPKIAGHD